MQAVPGAIFCSGFSFLKDGTIKQIDKLVHFDGKSAMTGVVKKKQSLFQIDKIRLVTDRDDIFIRDKLFPRLPSGLTDLTLLKIVHYPGTISPTV